MTHFSILKYFAFVFVSLSLLACKGDDSDSDYHSLFKVTNNGLEYPINDYHGFLDTDSSFVLSTFSANIPIEGLEDKVEDVYKKYNMSIVLNKLEEGNFTFMDPDPTVVFNLDTLYYSYSSTPYHIGKLSIDLKKIHQESTLFYMKQIIHGRDLVSGQFNIMELVDGAKPPLDSNVNFEIIGEFLNVPFTKK